MKGDSANIKVRGAAVELSGRVIVRNHVAGGAPFQHDSHVRPLDDIVLNQVGAGFESNLYIRVTLTGNMQECV